MIEKKPWLSEVTPRPLQTGQIVGAVPAAAPEPWQVGQALALSTGTCTVTPRRASANDRLTCASTSAPRRGPARAAAAAAVEEAAEQVAQVEAWPGAAEVEALEAARPARPLAGPERAAEAVVLLALLRDRTARRGPRRSA